MLSVHYFSSGGRCSGICHGSAWVCPSPLELEKAGVCPLEQEEREGWRTVQDGVVEVQQEHD